MSDNFERIFTGGDFYFRYAKGRSLLHGEEFHEHDEIIFYIGGGAKFISQSVQAALVPNAVVFVPRGTFHQLIYDNEDNYERCIFQFRGNGALDRLVKSVVGVARVDTSFDPCTMHIFNSLIKAVDEELSEYERSALLYSSFVKLIMDRKLFGWREEKNSTVLSSVTQRALEFIEENFSKSITLADVARDQHVSLSQLSHSFKSDLSISVYKYLNERRLSCAHELIKDGVSLGRAAALSGFCDYSSFFRIYKKKYGICPQERRKGLNLP